MPQAWLLMGRTMVEDPHRVKGLAWCLSPWHGFDLAAINPNDRESDSPIAAIAAPARG
jgi:hypothetical protein